MTFQPEMTRKDRLSKSNISEALFHGFSGAHQLSQLFNVLDRISEIVQLAKPALLIALSLV